MEVKRYVDFDGEGGGTAEARFGERGQYVEAQDFDRVTDERDALQLRLNAVEEENDRLRTLLRSMTCSYREAITNGHERITFLGGECDSPERMLNDNPNYAKSWEALEKRP